MFAAWIARLATEDDVPWILGSIQPSSDARLLLDEFAREPEAFNVPGSYTVDMSSDRIHRFCQRWLEATQESVNRTP